ncbi:MAG TPA: histidine kinase [Opitutaceae bacterium]
MALAATLIGLLVVHPENEEVKFLLGPTFLVTFGLVATSLLASVGLQVQAARQAARATQLTAARLEIELLKKNLQPHFLLNTLTALSEVVEQNPREAVSLIDDLAEEFRALSRMSGEKLIPISHELDLCRAHLRVMSLRTGRVWMLDTANVDEASLVPPALFLTLIENGFSHQRIAGAGGSFVLRQKAGPNASTTYVFVSPGVAHDEDVRSAGGTGIRYVKARLEESSPGRWTFRDRRTEAGWETVIEIRESAGAPCAS